MQSDRAGFWVPALLALAVAACHQGEGGPDADGTPIVRDDVHQVAEDAQDTVLDVLANDDDVYRIHDFTEAAHGVVTRSSWTGGLTYRPHPGYHGIDRFSYSVAGGGVAQVTVEVLSDGTPYEEAVPVLGGTSPSDISVVDIDGDGRLDVLVPDQQLDALGVALNLTETPDELVFSEAYFEGGIRPRALAVGDLDGDGRPEPVLAAASSDSIVVFQNRSSPGTVDFGPPLYLEAGGAPEDVVVLDLNGDGLDDLLFATRNESRLSVFMNRSAGLGELAFSIRYDFAAPDEPSALAVDDLDGDGRPDVVVASTTENLVALYLNATAIGDLVPAFAARRDRPTIEKPTDLALTDLDGDGLPELAVVGGSYGSHVWLHRNETTAVAEPVFGTASLHLAAYEASRLGVADADDDGHPDLVVGSSYTYGPQLSLLLNRTSGPGSLSLEYVALDQIGYVGSAQALSSSAAPVAMATGDLDGSGLPELIVAFSGSGTQALLGHRP